MHHSRRRARRALFVCGPLAAAVALAVGCSVPPPPGAAPLRYRDVIFPNLTITQGLVYGSAPDLSGNPVTLTLDMYRPSGDTQTSRPAIVLVHGGGFYSGDSTNAAMVKMANNFAKRGYVAVSINYRLLGDGNCAGEDPPSQQCVNAAFAAQHDAQAAVRWLRANAAAYGVDPTRIAIGGGSAGAVTALAVAVNSGDPGNSGNPGYSSKVGAAIAISGFLPHDESSLYDTGDSPILMFNGTADPVVDYGKGVQTAADLYNAHVPVVFEPLEGGGHVPFSTFGDLMISQSVHFAYAVLDLAHAAGQPNSAARAFDAKAAKLGAGQPAWVRKAMAK